MADEEVFGIGITKIRDEDGIPHFIELDDSSITKTAFSNAISDLGENKLDEKPDGTNYLIVDNKINTQYIPASILGQLEYKGTFDASSAGSSITGLEKGWYYICEEAGIYNPDGSAGPTDGYAVNDWAVYNGEYWDQIDNDGKVQSVNGYTGDVILNGDDVSAVRYDNAQDLNSTQQEIARGNINAADDADVVHKGTSSSSVAEDVYGIKTFKNSVYVKGANNVLNVYGSSLMPTTIGDGKIAKGGGNGQLDVQLGTNGRLLDAAGNNGLKMPVTSGWSSDKTIATTDDVTTHTNNTDNPHGVTAAQVGLGNVVNTGDSATPTQNGTAKFTTGGAYTLDQSVVHKTGDETIDGEKTFTSNVKINSGTLTLYNNNDPMPLMINAATASGGKNAKITKASGSGSIDLQLGVSGKLLGIDGTYGLKMPNTSSWTANKTIAIDEEVVHKAGDETITGAKTFENALTTWNVEPQGSNAFYLGNSSKYYYGAYITTLNSTTINAKTVNLQDIDAAAPTKIVYTAADSSVSYLQFPKNKGTSTTSAIIATTEDLTGLVHKGTSSSSINETIYGRKTFQDGINATGISIQDGNSGYGIGLSTDNGDEYPYFYIHNGSTGLGSVYLPAISSNDVKTLATTDDLSVKLDKYTTSSDAGVVYGVSGGGSQTTFSLSRADGTTLVANTIPVRTTDGQIIVPATPTANGHATSKKYVDDHIPTNITGDAVILATASAANWAIVSAASGTSGPITVPVAPSLTLGRGTATTVNYSPDGIIWVPNSSSTYTYVYPEKSGKIATIPLNAEVSTKTQSVIINQSYAFDSTGTASIPFSNFTNDHTMAGTFVAGIYLFTYGNAQAFMYLNHDMVINEVPARIAMPAVYQGNSSIEARPANMKVWKSGDYLKIMVSNGIQKAGEGFKITIIRSDLA